MAGEKKKPKKLKEKVVKTTKQAAHASHADEEDFDFGGLPENVPFKRNIGCGG